MLRLRPRRPPAAPAGPAPPPPPARRSHWDRLPAELHDRVLAAAGPLTRLLCGWLDADRLAVLDVAALWAEVFESEWPGDLRLLPSIRRAPSWVFWSLRSRALFDRLCEQHPGARSLGGAAHAAIRNQWADVIAAADQDWLSVRACECGAIWLLESVQRRNAITNLGAAQSAAAKAFTAVSNQFAKPHGRVRYTRMTFKSGHADAAAAFGQIETLRFLRKHMSPAYWQASVMDAAASHGHLATVEWLFVNRLCGCTPMALDSAAAGGHLDIVAFIHEHMPDVLCTHEAMDGAAKYGHLDVVKYIHDHGIGACTTAAMDGAAANGHLAVVAFLHESRNEGCTQAAIDGAAANGHLAVVDFLRKHRGLECSPRSLVNAAAAGHFRVVQYLVESAPSRGWDIAAARGAALELGRTRVVRTLDSIAPRRRAHAAAPLAETGTLEFVDPVVGGNRGRTTGRFNGFVLGGTTFRLGDVVLLEQISGAALDAMKLTHIARNDDEGDSDQDDLTNGRSGRAATARIGGRWIILPISPAQQGKTVAEQFERNEAGAAREVFVSSRFDFINPLDIVGTCTVVAEQALPKKLPKIAWSDRPVGDAVFFCSHRWNDRLNRPGRPIDWSEFEEIRDDAKPPIVLLGRRTLPSQSEEPLTPSRNAPSAKKPPASKPVVVIPTRQKKSSAAAAKAKPASKQSSKGARGKLTAVSADETSSDESSSSDGEDSDGADGTFESDQDDADDDDDLSSESSSDDPSTESELESDDDDFQKDTWRKAKPRTPQPKARSQAAASNKVTIKRKLAVSRSLTERIYKRAKSGPVRPVALPAAALRRSEAQTDFERARDMLHVGSVPESLPCRESEFFELLSYLDDAIRTDSGMCIYVSGVPGTGKTATFHGVLRTLRAQCDESLGEDEILPPFDFVEINGMKLTEPSQAYSVLWEGLTESKVSPKHAEQLLAQRFSTPSATRPMCVVLMDELDVLVTKKQSVIYNFFDWPNLAHSRLVVVAIANTMDLPERMLSNKVSSRLGLNRITFNPYTHTQLIEIVQSRLEGITAFDKSAVELCARKVGSVSGDARRALDICRRAVEIFEAGGGGVQTSGVIQTSHIDQAVKEMFASSSVQAIRRAGRQQRTFLVAVLRQIRSTGNTHVEFGSVAEEHEILCALQGIPAPAVSGLAQVCSSLAVYRLVLAETAKMGDPIQKIRLNVPPQDVQAAMRQEGDEALLRALG